MANNKKKPQGQKDVTEVLYKKKAKKKSWLAVLVGSLFATVPTAIVTVSVAVLLVLTMTFGATLGTVLIVKNSTSVVRLGTVSMNEGVAAYFVSRFKATYITSVQKEGFTMAGDYEDFWQSEYKDGQTHGERFEQEAKDYLKQLIVAARIFDSKSGLNKADKQIIKKAYEDVLEYQANGDEKTFNEMGKRYGFTYKDFKKAVTLLYKATQAYGILYQSTSDLTEEEKDAYLSEYTCARLLFIRTETKLVTNTVTGAVEEIALSDGEKEERAKVIAELRAAINAYNEGTDGQINEEMYEIYLSKYSEGDTSIDPYGYYFHPNAECTEEFREEFADVVDKAYEMRVGDYAEVKVSIGYCFIYKSPVISGIYDVPALERWFSDFLADVSVSSYSIMISESASAVKEGPRFSRIDFVSTPMNVELKIVGFGE